MSPDCMSALCTGPDEAAGEGEVQDGGATQGGCAPLQAVEGPPAGRR